MSTVLYIADPVITEATLLRQHNGQGEVCVTASAVVTPTGWDYLRQKQLRLSRGQVPAGSSSPVVSRGDGGNVAAETTLIQAGRCERPGDCYGCEGGEEFGSGFIEPASCSECPVQKLIDQGQPNCGCEGCNRQAAKERAAKSSGGIDSLVLQITDHIVQRLGA